MTSCDKKMTIILNDAILTSFRHVIMTSYFSLAFFVSKHIYNKHIYNFDFICLDFSVNDTDAIKILLVNKKLSKIIDY